MILGLHLFLMGLLVDLYFGSPIDVKMLAFRGLIS